MKQSHRRFAGVVLIAVLSLVATGTTPAQDVMKVSPETHKVLLENERVRVLDVHAKPGEKVAMHSHPPSILYYLTDGKLKITYPDGRTEERQVKAGTAVWSAAVTHAVENVGTAEFHEVHTELKGANTGSDDDLSAAKQQVLELEQVWVTAEHNHDAATLRRILDDKFLASFGAEKPLDKEAFIKLIVTEDADPTESQTLTDRNVILDHGTALVVGIDTERGTKKGKPYTAIYRYTVTYVRRNEQWVALAEHLVEVPQAK